MTDGTVSLYFGALTLSLAYKTLPGPVLAETLRRGLARGFGAALSVQLGALAGGLVWAVAALLGLGMALQRPTPYLVLSMAGSALLVRMAWTTLVTAGQAPAAGGMAARARGGGFVIGRALALLSPAQLVFWLGIGASTIVGDGDAGWVVRVAVYLAGFTTGSLMFAVGSAALVARGQHVLNRTVIRVVHVLCALALLSCAVRLLDSTLERRGAATPPFAVMAAMLAAAILVLVCRRLPGRLVRIPATSAPRLPSPELPSGAWLQGLSATAPAGTPDVLTT